MTARTESASWPQPRWGTEGATLLWLDALAGGICTPEAFLSAVQEQAHGDSDESWEILSLLDQYYRRGKIKAELFHTVKSSLEGSALNGGQEVTSDARPRARTAVPPTTVAPTTVLPATVTPTKVRPTTVPPITVTPTKVRPTTVPPITVATTKVLPTTVPPIIVGPTAVLSTAVPPITIAPTALLPATVPPITVAPTAVLPTTVPPARVRPTTVPPTTATRTVAPASVTSASVTAPATMPPGGAPTASRPAVREVRREVAIGDVLRGRYRIQAVLGHGGMGTVFDAVDEYRLGLPSSGQRIAIKVLHTAVTQRDELLAELQREFQHLQLLSHPNIVRVHEFDRDGENAFFTMEALIGALLSQVIGARNAVVLPRPYALAIMREVGAALTHAHSRGVVHGDINPQNIFITGDGELRVLDFGASHGLLWDVGLSLRAPVATPGYASCQLLEGQHPDARDDLFAFACVAYLLLAGQHPFPRRTAVEARAQRLRPPRPPGLTGRQWRVLREGLRWERDRRPADVRKWLDRFDLDAAAPHLPPLAALMNVSAPRKSRGVLATVVIAMLALLAAGAYWAVTDHDALARLVMLATSSVTHQESPPPNTESAPAPRSNPPPAPAPIARKASAAKATGAKVAPPTVAAPTVAAPTAAVPMAAVPMATATATAAAAPTATAPAAAVPPTPTSSPGVAAAPTRLSTAETSVRAGNAGPIRIEMAADTVDVEPSDWAARITVRRRGNLRGDASFTWWTESGTAKPGRDFVPVIPTVERIPNGSGSITLNVPVLSTPRGKAKSFYVVIDRTEPGGAALGERNLTMVTIQPPN